ncbi:inositol 1,4,5-trisphosphate receptor type 2-like [Ruditapes philippinarum]|uniref:inositol 1,4,5-trisphosphate receptor type 2-like n=1 Tax=Ruditapes philippinarum TaxID=129788 RepID=UPI00295A5705|nr:inositol 1,4,5-trisphosphate receptor type 2-like [Ruditapes philippinarum]
MAQNLGEFLCVGDSVCFFSVETEGFAYSLQSSSVHSHVFIYQNQDRDKPTKIPSAQACEFIVGLQNRYKLNKKFRKYKSMVANSEGIIHEDETLLRQHKMAAEAENMDNAQEQKRQLGKRVRYGEIVQLKHVFTNKYIHTCTSQTSQVDKNNMVIMLQEYNAKNAQFRILPQYKVKSEGEVVQIYDQIVFESVKSPGHFIHASSPFQIDHFTFGSEFNLGVERSGFTLIRFRKRPPTESLIYIRGGNIIRLFHKELEAYVVAEGLFEDEITEDVHFRVRVMDQHKPRTLSPPTSGNTFWVIEAEKGIFHGEIIQWEQQIRLRHMTTRKYICITAEHEVILIDSNEDPRTVFRLHSVINERDEIRFESYCRIEHVLTGSWLHALKDEDYIRKQFRDEESCNDQSLKGLRVSSAPVKRVTGSSESQYDDAFTIQRVEDENIREFNYVAGMVPFLQNLIKDRQVGITLNSKKTHQTVQAMDELQHFMIVENLPSKERQKLMRNLRVIDLLVKILQFPLDGVADEHAIILVFKEAYEILYTYMIGKSRKNALYFAKYIEFFQTQFTQKGGIGLNVAQMIVELIRDKRKIVDRISHHQIDEFVGLLQSTQNYRFLDLLHVLCVCDDIAIPNNQVYIVQKWMLDKPRGIFLTARGQDINKQPNILYITTDDAKTWSALHDFVNPEHEEYEKDKHDFLLHQLDLFIALCKGRNDFAINIITKESRFLTWEETFLALRSSILPDAIRAKYCDITTNLFVDIGNNYSVLAYPNICFVYDYVGSKDEEKSAGDFIMKELVAIFPVLRDWIAEFLSENLCMYASEIGHNMLIEQVLRLLYFLVKFGYYMDSEDVDNLLPPLLNLLDGRHDYPFPAKDKGYSKDEKKKVHAYQMTARFEKTKETEAISRAKFQVLEVLDLLLTYQRNLRLQSFVGKFKIAEQLEGEGKTSIMTPLLYDTFNPHDQSKKAIGVQKKVNKELNDMFKLSALFDLEFLTKVLMDLSMYKDNKMVLKSMTIMNKLYSTKSCMFNIGSQAQILLTQDSARVHREVLKNMPVLRRLSNAKLDDLQIKMMGSILDDLAEFCHLPMTPDEPHPMNQNILISNGVLDVLFTILEQDIDPKLMSVYSGMADIFKKSFYLLKLLARENFSVQYKIMERLDIMLNVKVVESDLAIALKEVFNGNQFTCLKISQKQIQKIVTRIAELQEKAPEFLDLLGMVVKVSGLNLTLKRNQAYVMKYIMQSYRRVAFVLDMSREERINILTDPGEIARLRYYISLLDLLAACAEGENMFIESLCQTILPIDDLLMVLNSDKVDNVFKKPFLKCLHHVYMKTGDTKMDTGASELSHFEEIWHYISIVSLEMNKLTDSIKADPDKMAIYINCAPEKSGQAAAPDFESSSFGTMLYFLEGVLPFLTSFYQYFYYPERHSHPNELDETDHIAKAVVLFGEILGPLIHKPLHMKNISEAITVLVPISNMPNSNIETILGRWASGIEAEDTSSAIRKGNIEYYSDEVEINAKFRSFTKNCSIVFAGHNTVAAQLGYNLDREYTVLGGDEELPLGEEFQSLVKCFVNHNEKKTAKKYEWTAKLIEQLKISSGFTRLTEQARQEMDELNIKCLQILRAMVHNEERRLPDDWPTRTAEPKVAKILRGIGNIQKFYDSKDAMMKILPHLATRNEQVAKETLGFLCALLLNANRTVQESMMNYFLSTKEEVFFMAIRDRMSCSTNTIKEKRSLQAQMDVQKKKSSTKNVTSRGDKTSVSVKALQQIQAYETALRLQRLNGWKPKRHAPKNGHKNGESKDKKEKINKAKEAEKDKKKQTKAPKTDNKGKKKPTHADGAEVASTTKDDLALINDAFEDNEVAEVKVEIPDEIEDPNPDEDVENAEEEMIGYIELALKVMARMCDGQNHTLQDYLREQPDNVKSFNIIGEVTQFLNVIYSNITAGTIDLVGQLFDTMTEFTAGNQENRIVIYDNKIIDYINFILRAGEIGDCPIDKILSLRESISNLVLALVEENGAGKTQVAMEVKDSLDKKAVVKLMTESFEHHGIDKKKLAEMKYIEQEGHVPQQKKSKIALFKEKILRSIGNKDNDEFAEEYEDVGYRLYLILARMVDIDVQLLESLRMTPLQLKAYNFYKKNCQSIEIVKDDELQKANFRVKTTRVLREEVKEMLKWSVDRSSPSNKIRDLMAWSVDIMKDIAYQRKILNNPVAVVLTKGWLVWNNSVTILSFAINILMLMTWNAKASLNTSGIYKNSTAIPLEVKDPIPEISNLTADQYALALFVLGGLHNTFCFLVLISYFVGNHPRLPDPKAAFLEIKECLFAKKREEEDLDEDKTKEHVAKMDATLLSFTTFYYISFFALSIGGTMFHGYFFAYHLLNIVNGNQLLSGVIKAVTQNGRSLVWVGILGLCVFYLYAIISFALMRSMFDPNDYLYCDTLWQCTLTIIRYGLIGDLFDNIKAHKTEKNFRMFGFVVLYHVSFFIFITTIGLNIIFGIIVDTFSELRDLKWTAESDMRDTCFICSRNSYDFEHHGNGFEQHVRHEHNMWAYIFFFIHLDGTKLNDYTALEMYVFKHLQKENYDFFPLDRALSLAAMGQDSTEVKIDDLLYHVTSIVQKQKKEELEKKRLEEKMRQVAWEERHRMVPIRDSLNIAQNEDYLLVSQEQEDQIFDTLVVGSPPQGLSPTYSRRTSVATATRRPSAAGSGYQTPLNRHDKYRRRRSVSPMEKDTLYRIVSPSRGYDDDLVSLSGTQVYGWEERIHSPTLFGLDEDVLDIIPVPYSRRQSFDRLRSPRLSIAPGHRELQTYYSESDPTPYLRQLAQQYSQERERRLSQQFPDGQPLTLPPETERGDTDSITSEVGPPDTQF